MMNEHIGFSQVLNRYVRRAAYTPGQLAALSGLPKSTIINWLRGRVEKPQAWQSIVRLLAVLHLDEGEASAVLKAAGHPPIAALRPLVEAEERALLQAWQPPPVAAPSARSPFQAIADVPYLVGRKGELAQVAAWLRAGERSVIQGLPGVGKTALAARLAYRLRPHFPDGVLWARLAASDPMSVLSTFARAYGADVDGVASLADRSRVVRDLLADKRALLVLDDVEDSAQVEALLPPSGRCAVLLTTRRQNLRVARGARRLTLRPFSPANNAGRQLFTQILGEARVQAEATLFDQIAHLLGHLPLALLIVASRLAWEPGWETADFLRRLQQRAERLPALRYEGEGVAAAFALSVDPLPEAQRRFFAVLAAFAGDDFDAAAAAAAAGIADDAAGDHLRALYARSLVQTPRSGRYSLHPLLRDYAGALPGDREAGRRLARYYLNYLEDDSNLAVAVIHEEANIEGALNLVWQEATYDLFCELVLAFVPFLRRRGRLDLARDLLSQAGEVATGAQAVSCQVNLAAIARRRHRYEEAAAILAGVSARLPDDSPAKGAFLVEQGTLAACRGDYARAQALFRQALPLLQAERDIPLRISLLKELGVAQVAQRDYEEAAVSYEQALALARREAPADAPTLLRCLGGLAIAQEQDYERAHHLYQEALALVRQAEARPALAILLNNLAATAVAQGAWEQAKMWLEEGVTVARQTGERATMAMILTNLGRLAGENGEQEAARAYFRQALDLAEEIKRPAVAAAARAGLKMEEERLESPPSLTIIFD